ncbi:MAG: hypothetical protein ABFS35_22430, partial [Bacteroidota bacterium]
MKQILLLISILFQTIVYAQTTINYRHCNCTENINYSETNHTLRNGTYEFVCDNSLIEKGNYVNGQKDGIWTVKNELGIVVSKIEYSEGKLNGTYELYHFEGKPKIKASFENNLPSNDWVYYNKKGKIVKQGSYENGKPKGLWRVYNKKGKKVVASYNFDTHNSTLPEVASKYKNPFFPRDDESGEYIITSFPYSKITSSNKPIGGYIRANMLYNNLFNVPFVLMNTYSDFFFMVNAEINE